MRACPECGGSREYVATPDKPDMLSVWESHSAGCSLSPMVKPSRVVHLWRMGERKAGVLP